MVYIIMWSNKEWAGERDYTKRVELKQINILWKQKKKIAR